MPEQNQLQEKRKIRPPINNYNKLSSIKWKHIKMPILDGKMYGGVYSRKHANVGDWFIIEGIKFEVYFVELLTFEEIAKKYHKAFNKPDKETFIADWEKNSAYHYNYCTEYRPTRRMYLHLFRKL